jgi:hypothetical protein
MRLFCRVGFELFLAKCRTMTKTDKLLAAYEHFGAAIAGIPDERAQSLYRTSAGARGFVADVRARHPAATSSQVSAGLEQGLRETPQLIQGIAPQWRAAVSRAFHDALMKEFPAFIGLEEERLKKILARGKISSEAEFYRIRHEIDVVEGQPSRHSELESLYALVEAFDARA